MALDQRLVWGGVAAGGAGIAIYLYRKNKKQQTAAAQAGQQAGYGYGYGYGSQALQYQAYGYGFGSSGLGAYGGAQGNYGYGYYGAGSGSVQTQVPTQATTNAQWAEAAMSALTSAGYDGQTVLAALGVYLTGGTVTAQQLTIIQGAIAAEGYPPVPGPNNYPPQIHTGGTGGGGGGGGQGGGGTSPSPTRSAGPISNLRVVTVSRTTATIGWNAAQNATQGYSYEVKQTNGVQAQRGSTSGTRVNLSGLHPGWTYNFGVQGLPGGAGNNIHFTMKK